MPGIRLLLCIHRESLRCAVSIQVKIWSPVKEGGPDFTSLLKTMKKNGKEREAESGGEGALMDSHMLWFLMQHLRRRRRRRRRMRAGEGGGGGEGRGDEDDGGDDDDDDDGEGEDSSEGENENDAEGEGGVGRVVDCNPS